MSIILKSIIEFIKYGPHLKSDDGAGTIKYLKGSHFNEDYELTLFNGSYTRADGSTDKYLLKEEDILLAAKGYRNFAWNYTADAGPCIASSTFYVFKVNQSMVMPEYFTLLINSPKVQHKLRFLGLGPVTPSIPKDELLNIKVNLPSMQEQINAIKIYSSIKQQIKLQRRILEQKINLKNGLLDLLTTKKMQTNKKVL